MGVDVFFVISGYLITSLISLQIKSEAFSLLQFYERRIRRILPALFFVMFCCIPFAWYWMLPIQLKQFSSSLLAIPTFWSNILFWQESGYFGTAADVKPLLHTWSLAVEEQFYIVFPFIMLFLCKYSRRRIVVGIIALSLISLASAQFGGNFKFLSLSVQNPFSWFNQPSWASFYLVPGRIWELLAGSLVALYLEGKQFSSGRLSESLSAGGVMMIMTAVIIYDETIPTPSVYTILPVLGTLLIIVFANSGTIIGRFFSLNIPVVIGLSSYSIYLWHQPLLAFARLRSLNELGVITTMILVLTSFMFGFLTYRFVEQPFRERGRFNRSQIFGTAGIAGLVLTGLGTLGYLADGFPARLETLNDNTIVSNVKPDLSGCPWKNPFKDYPYIEVCEFGASDGARTVLLLGDSHADQLGPVLDTKLKDAGLKGLKIRNQYCGAIGGIHDSAPVTLSIGLSVASLCQQSNIPLYKMVKSMSPVGIVISVRWSYRLYPAGAHIDSWRFDNKEGGLEDADAVSSFVIDSEGKPSRRAELKSIAFSQYFDELSGFNIPIVVVYPIPELGWNLSIFNQKSILFNGKVPPFVSTAYLRYQERNKYALSLLDSLDTPNLRRVRVEGLFCDNYIKGRCVGQINGKPLYFDDDHLNHEGIRILMDEIWETLNFSGKE